MIATWPTLQKSMLPSSNRKTPSLYLGNVGATPSGSSLCFRRIVAVRFFRKEQAGVRFLVEALTPNGVSYRHLA